MAKARANTGKYPKTNHIDSNSTTVPSRKSFQQVREDAAVLCNAVQAHASPATGNTACPLQCMPGGFGLLFG
ncbi:MAG: hypothetical protein HC773_11795 [Scytonema sp. CRU_2_7]|nr:hypothetical protein [Scytonema sp. CRU_2_7]